MSLCVFCFCLTSDKYGIKTTFLDVSFIQCTENDKREYGELVTCNLYKEIKYANGEENAKGDKKNI